MERANASDLTFDDLAARLVWKLAKHGFRLLGSLALAVFASICAALILLLGVEAVLNFISLGIWYAQMLVKTIISVLFVIIASAAASVVFLAGIIRLAAHLARSRSAIMQHWRALKVVRKRLHRIFARLRVWKRAEPESDQMMALAGILLIMTFVLSFAYLEICGLDSWRAIQNAQLPGRVPVARIGRIAIPPTISTVREAHMSVQRRREKVLGMAEKLAKIRGVKRPLESRCGRTLPLHPIELQQIAELLVDLTDAPPITKREYVLTEEQLTEALSAFLASRNSGGIVDCVKLHRNKIRLFATTVGGDGVEQYQSGTISIVKDTGDLRMRLEELSFGRASLHVSWLGFGVADDQMGFTTEDEASEQMEGWLRTLDSRVFSVNVNPGHVRIITWRLPSIVAARAAKDVGHSLETVEHRIEPRGDAEPLGKLAPSDLLYVLESTRGWSYVCSEVSGRCGWLPDASFVSLANDPLFANGG